jgi:adenylate kinase family enzyme
VFNKESKVFVGGTSGSGKSTFARTLSQKIGVVDIELDQLFWKENWTESQPEEFRAKITKAINDNQGWVMHGNYNKVPDFKHIKVIRFANPNEAEVFLKSVF